MEECLFCKIIKSNIPAKIIHEDEDTMAFYDINPVAPTHVLIVPKKHISRISDMKEGDIDLVGKLFYVAKKIMKELSIEDYRLIFNNGSKACQSVFHLHLHVLGGREFSWPEG